MSLASFVDIARQFYRGGATRLAKASRRIRLSTQIDRLEILIAQVEAQQKSIAESARLLSGFRWEAMAHRAAAASRTDADAQDPALRDVSSVVRNVWRQELGEGSS